LLSVLLSVLLHRVLMQARCSLFTLLAVASLPRASSELSFDAFLSEFGKSYAPAEYQERKAVFEHRAAEVEALNAHPGRLWTAGLNLLTDLTEEELIERRGYNKAMREAFSTSGPMESGLRDIQTRLPAGFDWRDHRPSVITPVKEQGSCGSCWAFSATSSIESHVAISTGKLLSLSPQELTSCTPNPKHCGGGGGCSGAIAQLAFNYTAATGLREIWTYPYESGTTRRTGECRDMTGRAAAQITGYVQLPPNDAGALLEALFTIGPVSISVDASKWYLYSAGIFDLCNKTNPDINHAVQLVGYGASDGGLRYWSVRNSWGVLWGEDGYIRLRRYRGVGATPADAGEAEPCGEDTTPQDGSGCDDGPASVTVCGACGLLSDSSYPAGGSFGSRGRTLPGQGRAMHASAVQIQRFSN